MSRPLAFGLFLAGLAVSGCTLLQGIQPNDEGLMLAAADRIADGQVPYRDFWWYYPPGQPYLLAGLQSIFGASLLEWRILRVLTDAAVGVLVYALAARGAGSSRRAPLAAWAVAVLAMAYPTGPHPFPIALALGLGALLAFERRPALAGALAGASAAWRVEFAAALAAGIALAGVLGAWPALRPALARFAGAALATATVLIGPVVLAAGLGRSWDLLVDFPLTDFRDYQSLPFPLDYDGPLNTSSPGGFLSDSAEPLLLFYLPLVLVIGLALAGVALGSRLRRDPLLAATAVYALCMLGYLLVRPDLFHTAPLAVLVAVLGAWVLPRGGWHAVALAGVLAYATVEGLDRRWLGLREDSSRLELPVADGVRARPGQARSLERLSRRVDALLAAREPLYVATARSDLMTSGHPLLYFLLRRPNPTAYDIAQPGVVTTAPVQRAIVAALERRRVRMVVRFDDPVTTRPEPNAAGRSSGVRILDRHLAAAYVRTGRIGPFALLVRR